MIPVHNAVLYFVCTCLAAGGIHVNRVISVMPENPLGLWGGKKTVAGMRDKKNNNLLLTTAYGASDLFGLTFGSASRSCRVRAACGRVRLIMKAL